jgi:Tol biopolymer transport system component
MIAFDGPSDSGFFDVYTIAPDGSNLTCLTCGAKTLPAYNKGCPEWHPSGKYLAIEVQTIPFPSGTAPYAASFPGGGYGSDLFIMDAAGKTYTRMTHSSPNPAAGLIGGVLHPKFSHDGSKVIWAQAVPGTSGQYWNLMLADFSTPRGVPELSNIQSLPPCASNTVFCETGDFSRDDSTIFFTGVLDNQPLAGMDIYSYELGTGNLKNLTNSPNLWDELPRSAPGEDKIAWVRGTGSAYIRTLKTDYWLMNYDGSSKVQLTFINSRDAAQVRRPAAHVRRRAAHVRRAASRVRKAANPSGVSAAQCAWSPDGAQLASQLTPNGVAINQGGSLYLQGLATAAQPTGARRPKSEPNGPVTSIK